MGLCLYTTRKVWGNQSYSIWAMYHELIIKHLNDCFKCNTRNWWHISLNQNSGRQKTSEGDLWAISCQIMVHVWKGVTRILFSRVLFSTITYSNQKCKVEPRCPPSLFRQAIKTNFWYKTQPKNIQSEANKGVCTLDCNVCSKEKIVYLMKCSLLFRYFLLIITA